MTLPQALAFGILAAMMALFIWGRLRYDLVALVSLLAAVAVGIVPPKEAFSGFSDDIVIIVASALLVSAAIARSGVVEVAISAIAPRARSTRAQVLVLVGIVTLLSAFIKNIGALAMLIPVAFQVARRNRTQPSALLMPMAFGALLGGIVTLVGTSPNIIVSRVRAELTGQPFAMFDFAPVGVGLAVAGLVFLGSFYWLLPARAAAVSLEAALDVHDYTTEACVPAGSSAAGMSVADLHRFAEGEVSIAAIIRGGDRSAKPLPDAVLREGDTLLLEGEPTALERLVARAGLRLTREDRPLPVEEAADEIGVVEGVVTPRSMLADRTIQEVELYQRFGVNLLGVSRSGHRITERLRAVRLRAGDVVLLQGVLAAMPERLRDLGLLPLAERSIALGSVRRGWIALTILAVAVTLVAFSLVPVAIAFFGAAVLLVLTGALPLREAYDSIEWPILVMLGALIPVSDALRTTGGTDVIAAWLSTAGAQLPGIGALALIMVAAMAVTPFLNNAATVLVMGPIAAGFAAKLGYAPDAFLMAVAIGAACDFLTPIGHQCNTLVMGPGGYRFGDYWRLGLPLSLLVVALGVPLLTAVWPLR